ncbi:MAG: hypothetical protein GXP52_01680 [Deltaproteobacteria bacterium]|nr:hypothetical protein [Deltaproteobacteria bacterium]
MINKGKRISGIPMLITSNDKVGIPSRVSFSTKSFHEDWLQELIYRYPEVLPVDEIEPVFSPLISIAREFPTNAGRIDNIFISPNGYITVVETKLWRNPESRRLVVSQILDYAKELSTWTFEEFDEQVRQSCADSGGGERGIIELIKDVVGEGDVQESAVVDTICRNLRKGRFLLLIVGDGIREEVEAMVDFLNQTPQLHFNLALVELTVYELENDKSMRLVVPQVVSRTTEITRAIVRIEGREIEKITVEVDTPTIEITGKAGKRFRLTEDEFFKILSSHVKEEDVQFARQIIENAEKAGFQVDWLQANFVVKYRDRENSDVAFTVLLVNKEGAVTPGYVLGRLREHDSVLNLSMDFTAQTAALFEGVKPHRRDKESWNRLVSLGELKARYQDYMNIADRTIDQLRSLAKSIT